MGTVASQITSVTIVYTTVYSDADQSKHQSSASLAFVWGIHRGPVNSPHKWPVTRKMLPFDDVIMRLLETILSHYQWSLVTFIEGQLHSSCWRYLFLIWGWKLHTVYPKKYAHGFVVLCFVVVMQSFIMNSHEVFIHIHQGCFAGTGAIVRLPQCQWSKPGGYGKISQCITTAKHSKAKTVCIFIGIYCMQDYSRIFQRPMHQSLLHIILQIIQHGKMIRENTITRNSFRSPSYTMKHSC